ncbi:MAG TPA: hypothetical protein VGG27_20465 [Magnetospirillaceae bacterium]|jgi:plastocyanin
MRVRVPLAGLLALACVSAARAEDLTVHIADDGGHPVADSVITLIPQNPANGPAAQPKPETRVIDQKDETFIPYVQIVRPGDPIVFRNSDDTRHHVYSFAKIKAFEFVLAPGESSVPMQIAAPGIAVVGCNIHDNMINYLFVSDAPYLAQTRAEGSVTFANLSAGTYALHIWHPQLHPGTPEIVQSVTMAGSGPAQTINATLALLPDPRQRMDHEHMRY